VICALRQPVVLKNVDFGPARSRWTIPYLQKKIGNKKVSVHICPETRMDFLDRNYTFRSMLFRDLLDRASRPSKPSSSTFSSISPLSSSVSDSKSSPYFVCPSEKYYFRSLGMNVRKEPSHFLQQFPELINDFHFPAYIDKSRYFSSVFRVSSGSCQLWTHYDICDNILCHVKGKKRVVLFPPSDVPYLYIRGSSSTLLDIDNANVAMFPKYAHSHPLECILCPGDILFIPGTL